MTKPCNIENMKKFVAAPNKEHLLLWVEALESGDYLQGRGNNYSAGSNSYCCLGVACHVAEKAGVDFTLVDWRRMGDLPRQVFQWLGVDSTNPLVDVVTGFKAITANDSLRWDFARIAGAIRRTYDLGDKPEVEIKKEELVG